MLRRTSTRGLEFLENAAAIAELDQVIADAAANPPATVDDGSGRPVHLRYLGREGDVQCGRVCVLRPIQWMVQGLPGQDGRLRLRHQRDQHVGDIQSQVCQFTRGSDSLKTLNINGCYYARRVAGLSVVFAFSGYALVYVLMKLRTEASKKAVTSRKLLAFSPMS